MATIDDSICCLLEVQVIKRFSRAQIPSLTLHNSILGVVHGKGLTTIQQHLSNEELKVRLLF